MPTPELHHRSLKNPHIVCEPSPIASESDVSNYDEVIHRRADHVFDIMAQLCGPQDLARIREAFEFARVAHKSQTRKTGEPYILHPIAVATICAEELMLEANVVIAAFLHDVVEDTEFTLEDIRRRFGDDVAFLVDVVTKRKKDTYVESKQVDNFRQMLDSIQYDIRALLVKLADRLHNMRTLSSMQADKQMKIAGETDYFYAPLANRLGLYNVKTELENLSFRFRCPHEFAELQRLIQLDEQAQRKRLKVFADEIRSTLEHAGIFVDVKVQYRQPYSIWRKMHKYGDDFNHLKYRHFTDIIYRTPVDMSEKDMALRIYSVLTDRFREKPGGISNYIDSPKENGYQSFHVKLLADFGRWQEVHICSERMVRNSSLGCIADRSEDSLTRWIEKFRNILKDIARHTEDGPGFIDKVVASFYNDDIMTFTPKGREVILPQRATVLDFAYELGTPLGEKAKYARVNGFLSSVKAELRRGDVVEIFTDAESHPRPDWLDAVVSYKARKEIRAWLEKQPKSKHHLCQRCRPIPGEEVIGFQEADDSISIHKRDCPEALRLASQQGDKIKSVEFLPDKTLYPVTIQVKAVDRFHLFLDLVDCISNKLHLAMDSVNTETHDSIVDIRLSFGVHSFSELQTIIDHIAKIDGVDEIKRFS